MKNYKINPLEMIVDLYNEKKIDVMPYIYGFILLMMLLINEESAWHSFFSFLMFSIMIVCTMFLYKMNNDKLDDIVGYSKSIKLLHSTEHVLSSLYKFKGMSRIEACKSPSRLIVLITPFATAAFGFIPMTLISLVYIGMVVVFSKKMKVFASDAISFYEKQ